MTAVAPPAHALTLKPTHKAVATYYDALTKFKNLGVKHETAVRSAFQELLEHCARQFEWKLVPEYAIKRKGKADAKVDGALLDTYGLNHGLWEAKDSDDNLDKEIKIKFALGYPKQNILFWQPDRGVLYRNGERFYDADLTEAEDLVHILSLFLEFAPPAIAEWQRAVEEFRDRVPQIGASLRVLIEKERQTNKKFISAFDGFCSLCRSTLNPNISIEAVEEMIIQHILTERILRPSILVPSAAMTSARAWNISMRQSKMLPPPLSISKKSKPFSTPFMSGFSKAFASKWPTPTASFIPHNRS